MPKSNAEMKKPRILWIEDDLKYARLLQLELDASFELEVHPDLSDLLRSSLAQAPGYDGVIIDMHLAQGRKGPEACRRIRELQYPGPVFVLSNDETVVSKLEMLSLGVDDYLWKVMPTEEIELRLRNSIQRYREKFSLPAASRKVSLDGLEMNLDRLTATLDARILELSKIEFRILMTLFRHHPQHTPIESLKREAWEGVTVEDGTLSTFFWKLNKKTRGWKLRIVRAGEEVSLQPSLNFN
jgi:DNA-binding response OmpR family regulator